MLLSPNRRSIRWRERKPQRQPTELALRLLLHNCARYLILPTTLCWLCYYAWDLQEYFRLSRTHASPSDNFPKPQSPQLYIKCHPKGLDCLLVHDPVIFLFALRIFIFSFKPKYYLTLWHPSRSRTPSRTRK